MLSASYLGAGREPAPGYRLLRLLGRGAVGSVWEGTRPDGGRVAMKFVTCSDGPAAAAEIRAIQAVRELRHPGLVRVHQVWCQRKHLVICMDLADGSLADLRTRHGLEPGLPLDPDIVCRALAQAANALDFLNARQHLAGGRRVAYQHGDVKPTNLLLFGDTVKLSDFGLAAQIAGPAPKHRLPGAPGYAAPEFSQGIVSSQSDQYGLAVTYCELRTGRLPFSEEALRGQGLAQQFPKPDLSLLDPEEQPVVARALSRLPQDRWPTCRKFIAELERL